MGDGVGGGIERADRLVKKRVTKQAAAKMHGKRSSQRQARGIISRAHKPARRARYYEPSLLHKPARRTIKLLAWLRGI